MSLKKCQIASKLIIDFKHYSPKYGDLFGTSNPVEVAKKLEQKGVLGLSVVTEGEYFGGSLSLLRDICNATRLPVLRKDFIQTEQDLIETVECGAKSILLIVATCKNIEFLYNKSLELGLIPLIEVHNLEEMDVAKQLNAKYIGINNKDITNYELDELGIETTENLITIAPKDSFIISESGINSNEDVEKVLCFGADAVIIGTAFWQGRIPLY